MLILGFSSPLSLHLKTMVSVLSQRSAGTEFHADGPVTEKARSVDLDLVL